jgi:hypothetical protein
MSTFATLTSSPGPGAPGRIAAPYGPGRARDRCRPGLAKHRRGGRKRAPERIAGPATLALEHPAYSCNWIAALLMLDGKRVSGIELQSAG